MVGVGRAVLTSRAAPLCKMTRETLIRAITASWAAGMASTREEVSALLWYARNRAEARDPVAETIPAADPEMLAYALMAVDGISTADRFADPTGGATRLAETAGPNTLRIGSLLFQR